MADKLRCMNQVKLLDINVCHQKQNKEIDGKRFTKRENQKEKKVKRVEILGSYIQLISFCTQV